MGVAFSLFSHPHHVDFYAPVVSQWDICQVPSESKQSNARDEPAWNDRTINNETKYMLKFTK